MSTHIGKSDKLSFKMFVVLHFFVFWILLMNFEVKVTNQWDIRILVLLLFLPFCFAYRISKQHQSVSLSLATLFNDSKSNFKYFRKIWEFELHFFTPVMQQTPFLLTSFRIIRILRQRLATFSFFIKSSISKWRFNQTLFCTFPSFPRSETNTFKSVSQPSQHSNLNQPPFIFHWWSPHATLHWRFPNDAQTSCQRRSSRHRTTAPSRNVWKTIINDFFNNCKLFKKILNWVVFLNVRRFTFFLWENSSF
jgi:hypothetical protein